MAVKTKKLTDKNVVKAQAERIRELMSENVDLRRENNVIRSRALEIIKKKETLTRELESTNVTYRAVVTANKELQDKLAVAGDNSAKYYKEMCTVQQELRKLKRVLSALGEENDYRD